MDSKQIRFLEYHEGYYAVGNNIPFDESASDDWKEGWNDGYESIYGDEFLNIDDLS